MRDTITDTLSELPERKTQPYKKVPSREGGKRAEGVSPPFSPLNLTQLFIASRQCMRIWQREISISGAEIAISRDEIVLSHTRNQACKAKTKKHQVSRHKVLSCLKHRAGACKSGAMGSQSRERRFESPESRFPLQAQEMTNLSSKAYKAKESRDMPKLAKLGNSCLIRQVQQKWREICKFPVDTPPNLQPPCRLHNNSVHAKL